MKMYLMQPTQPGSVDEDAERIREKSEVSTTGRTLSYHIKGGKERSSSRGCEDSDGYAGNEQRKYDQYVWLFLAGRRLHIITIPSLNATVKTA